MKKYMAMAASICLGAGLLSGCGGASEATTEVLEPTVSVAELDAAEYVKLGAYKGLTIEAAEEVKVTDKEIANLMESYAADYAEYSEVTDRDDVQKGDTVEVDLSLSINGTVDEDYTGEDIQIILGVDEFQWITDIDVDMEELLIGEKVGDTVHYEFTFPDDYLYDNYVGKDADFAITIKRIQADQLPEITDAWVQENIGADSVDEWKEQLKEELEADNEEQIQYQNISNMWAVIEENAEQIQEFPEDVMEDQMDAQREIISEYSAIMDIDESEYRQDYMEGLTVEEYVKKELFVQCIKDLIAEAEGFTVTDEELDEYLKGYIDGASFTDTDEVMEYFGGETAAKREILNEKVEEFLLEENTFE